MCQTSWSNSVYKFIYNFVVTLRSQSLQEQLSRGLKSRCELLAWSLLDNFYYICVRPHDQTLYASLVLILLSLWHHKVCRNNWAEVFISMWLVLSYNMLIQITLWHIVFTTLIAVFCHEILSCGFRLGIQVTVKSQLLQEDHRQSWVGCWSMFCTFILCSCRLHFNINIDHCYLSASPTSEHYHLVRVSMFNIQRKFSFVYFIKS